MDNDKIILLIAGILIVGIILNNPIYLHPYSTELPERIIKLTMDNIGSQRLYNLHLEQDGTIPIGLYNSFSDLKEFELNPQGQAIFYANMDVSQFNGQIPFQMLFRGNYDIDGNTYPIYRYTNPLEITFYNGQIVDNDGIRIQLTNCVDSCIDNDGCICLDKCRTVGNINNGENCNGETIITTATLYRSNIFSINEYSNQYSSFSVGEGDKSWVIFDVSPISDTAIITDIKLRYTITNKYFSECANYGQMTYYISSFDAENYWNFYPSTESQRSTIWTALSEYGTNSIYSETINYNSVGRIISLSSSRVISETQENIDVNPSRYLVLGFVPTSQNWGSYDTCHFRADTNSFYLDITYKN